jgi:YVTN family beta-propeller protein
MMGFMNRRVVWGVVVATLWTSAVEVQAAAVRRRAPVALIVADGGARVIVANRAGGTISEIDAATRTVVAEHTIGGSPADLAVTPNGRTLLVVDAAGDRLVVLERGETDLRVLRRLDMPRGTAGVAVAPDGPRAVVASTWARRLTIVDLDPSAGATVRGGVSLGFAPRRLVWASPTVVIAADAFGGGLAVVDTARGVVTSTRNLPAHNVGGLAMSVEGRASRLLLSQQYLNARADTRADDIHWGFLMTNSVRSLRLDAVLDPSADVVPGGRLDHLGEPGRGAGDPSGIVALPGGRVAVALAGVNEVAIGPLERPDAARVAVGRGPVALAVDPAGRLLYAAETFDDAVSVIDAGTAARVATISLGARPAENPAERGERLFADATRSHEGWMSCRSCHPGGHAPALLADTLGDGSYGEPKRTLSLLGLADTAPYGWDGRAATLEGQIRSSFETTLRGKAPQPDEVADVAAYLRALPPPPPLDAGPESPPAARGKAAFRRLACDRCHAPPVYTTPRSYDVCGSDDGPAERFNPPSLRGVGHRARLLHDGRARGLDELFLRFGHPDGREYSEAEAADLAAFLRRL